MTAARPPRSPLRRLGRWLTAGTPRCTRAASLAVIVIAVLLSLVPIPFVVWSPGATVDVLGPGAEEGSSALEIEGLPTHDTDGELRLTTVAVTRADSSMTLPAALISHLLPGREVLPSEAVYPPGTTQEETTTHSQRMMERSQQSAVVAGLRAADVDVTEVTMVIGITEDAPADGVLELGDTLLGVDGVGVDDPGHAVELIQQRSPGEPVQISLERDGQERTVELVTAQSPEHPDRPIIGATISTGYEHPGEVNFGIDPDIGGPSAGLVFALGIHDELTPGPLVGDHVVAGTGTIDPDGVVGPIGGINSKIAGAQRAGAEVFLMPAGNCRHLEESAPSSGMRIVPVDTIEEAIGALESIEAAGSVQAADPDLPRCQP